MLNSYINSYKSIVERLFTFIEVEKPTYPQLFFRVILGLICIGKFLVLQPNLMNFYGQYGLIQWSISKVSNYSFLPHIGDYAFFLSKHLNISIDEATKLFFTIFFCSCCFFLVGFLTRINSLLCFIFHLAIINTGSGIIYGVDVFTQLSLFYAIFFPLNSTYSIDSLIGISKFKKKSLSSGIAIRVVQIQMCMVYLSASIEKFLGTQWLNGEAIWRTLILPIFKTFDFSWMAQFPFIPFLLGNIVLVIELGYAFFMWQKNIRVVWLCLIILLHVNIGLLMGMWYFASIMIFLSLFAFADDILNDLLLYKKKRFGFYSDKTS